MKLVLLALFVACAFASLNERPEVLFANFRAKYNKVYATQAELATRFNIFKRNVEVAKSMNQKAGGATTYGVTKFMDLTADEFRASRLMPKGKINPKPESRFTEIPHDHIHTLPDSFEWNQKGAVTPVKDQGQCGSCWAFSATEAIESQWFLAGKGLPTLAPQQIVDCDVGTGDQGCNGGDTPTAYEYVIKAGGQDSETAYPYVGEDGTCAFKPSAVSAKIASWTYITKNKNETEMAAKLMVQGPLSICVDASSWQYYVGGVISTLCGTELDHCVMITGFRNQVDWLGQTLPIWNIRNSWGADWGNSGYVWVMRGDDLCGVAEEVTIPLVNA